MFWKNRPYYLIAFLLIILVWWFYPAIVSVLSNLTGAKLDASTDRLGTLFSALAFAGLFITIYYQRNDFKNERSYKNLNEFIELYRHFSSPEFRATRRIAWATLRKCIVNQEYADYVVSESYISRYNHRITDKERFRRFKKLYPEWKTQAEFCDKESDAIHKLDDLVNFYLLLSIKEVSNAYFDTSDFFYDSWRPMLYWYAFESEKAYRSDPINLKNNNPPGLRQALTRLDDKFFCPADKQEVQLTEDNIKHHVIIKGILDGYNG